MRRNALQLSRRHKAFLYAITLLVTVTGGIWWGLDRFASAQDEFGGVTHHPAQAWMLKAHGAGAMLSLLALGTLLPVHVKRGFQARKNLTSGVGLFGTFGVLIVTGYGLYYAGGETLRAGISAAHLWVGIALVPALAWHVARGHWLRRHGRLRHLAPAAGKEPAK